MCSAIGWWRNFLMTRKFWHHCLALTHSVCYWSEKTFSILSFIMIGVWIKHKEEDEKCCERESRVDDGIFFQSWISSRQRRWSRARQLKVLEFVKDFPSSPRDYCCCVCFGSCWRSSQSKHTYIHSPMTPEENSVSRKIKKKEKILV